MKRHEKNDYSASEKDRNPVSTETSENPEKALPHKGRKSVFWRVVKAGLILGAFGIIAAGGLMIWALMHYGQDLPDYRQLADYEPAIITRIHAGDGSLLREYAREPRLFIPIEEVPPTLINAFLAAEDKNFYSHIGLDFLGMVRAAGVVGINLLQGKKRLVGASTITQQVARNFLLTLDQRLDRKIKEMILTLRIERAFTKDQILELYLNEINFGNRSYGIAAAALNYFDKSLSELSISEMAYLAALPKAPHNYHPVRNKERALTRRNWVLSRMQVLGFIDEASYAAAREEDLLMRPRTGLAQFRADHFAEEVRRRLSRRYGSKALYEGGLSVRTTLEPALQAIAETELRRGLIAYDRRHGWRGPLGRMDVTTGWAVRLKKTTYALGMPSWEVALVHEVRAEGAIIGYRDSTYGWIAFDDLSWARSWRAQERLGPKITDPAEVLSLGDIVAVDRKQDADLVRLDEFWDDQGQPVLGFVPASLQQIPEVQGGLVAMNPHTGRVLALVGGFDFEASEYNRATQALRQPGSAFKPFVYAVALENEFTPSSLVLDAPFVLQQGEGLGKWKPKNSSNKFYGPSTLRLGIEKSRNLMTVRLAQHLGMRKIMALADRFKIAGNMEASLAASLGASEVTLLDLTAAYGMIVNGGKRLTPIMIDRIQDRRGTTIESQSILGCRGCDQDTVLAGVEPRLDDLRGQVLGNHTAYQLVSMMEGVVQNGTGRKIRVLNRPLAGKTGTTNDAADAWFVGFSPDMVVGVFVGFDQPRSLGRFEEGSSVAVPIFRDFMKQALEGHPRIPFRIPSGIRLMRVSRDTGLPALPGDRNIVLEAFKPGSEPTGSRLAVLDGSAVSAKKSIREGSGGIY